MQINKDYQAQVLNIWSKQECINQITCVQKYRPETLTEMPMLDACSWNACSFEACLCVAQTSCQASCHARHWRPACPVQRPDFFLIFLFFFIYQKYTAKSFFAKMSHSRWFIRRKVGTAGWTGGRCTVENIPPVHPAKGYCSDFHWHCSDLPTNQLAVL